MSTLSDILQSGRSAMAINQLAMQIIGHNTANVNTEGYSRRRIEIGTAPPNDLGNRWFGGSGIDIEYVGRVRDRLLDTQIREGTSEESYWTRRDDMLGRVEEVFGTLDGAAIGDQLSEFWNAWQDLANDPENQSARFALREKAETLASNVRRIRGALEDRRSEADVNIRAAVASVNGLTATVAELNLRILHAENAGVEASDLRDSRDLALEQLSQLIDIHTEESTDGIVNVYTGGHILVQRENTVPLRISDTASITGTDTVVSIGTFGQLFTPRSGELKALMELRDQELLTAMTDLDEFAVSLAGRVNAVHQSGYGLNGSNGVEFFNANVTGAENFQLSSLIQNSIDNIAASGAPNSPGDNSLALAVASIQSEKLMNGGRSTLDEFFAGNLLSLSSKREFASGQLEVNQGAMENLRNRRSQLSGVSLDEEMARLIQVQNAYEAAARIVRTVDEMMTTVMNLQS